MRRKIIAILGFVLALGLALGLPSAMPDGAIAQPSNLLVGAAASLQDALKEVTPLFQSAHPGITVKYSFAASGALQQQIEQGAPIDVFIAAASRQMDALQAKGRILVETRRNLLTNRLVLVVPRSSTGVLTDFRQLTSPQIKRISMGEPRSVPAGQYAEEVFRNLGLWEQIRPKLVFGNSVRNVLASVESGNADAGVVYVTDAKITDRVRQVAIAPKDSHSPIVYPVAIVSASRQQKSAQIYAQFLSGPLARPVFTKYGFGSAP
ncbi:MAG TPA: molybdate ABC transporter substrate-binding protein [Cyanobacteria bacterium UBA8156]|jgi:molybdate transport system substrate-binding protein|nr:molybdate ABC transporter substrate-binding protein [Cyanobacteria bacterium UBA8156]